MTMGNRHPHITPLQEPRPGSSQAPFSELIESLLNSEAPASPASIPGEPTYGTLHPGSTSDQPLPLPHSGSYHHPLTQAQAQL